MFEFGPLTLKDESATARLAKSLAPKLRGGDTLLFEGTIGAGKSAFCRALIHTLCGADTEVPSPTFTLVQTYSGPEFEIWHCDLYRLCSPEELVELGLDSAFETALVLIEWPERLGTEIPQNALTVSMQAHQDHHSLRFRSASDQWHRRLDQALARS